MPGAETGEWDRSALSDEILLLPLNLKRVPCPGLLLLPKTANTLQPAQAIY
jgi:hypothetical protein